MHVCSFAVILAYQQPAFKYSIADQGLSVIKSKVRLYLPGSRLHEVASIQQEKYNRDMAEDWITTAEAAELSGYHVDHVRRLVLANKVKARKWGRDWQVSRTSLLAYVRKTEEMGKRRGPKPRA